MRTLTTVIALFISITIWSQDFKSTAIYQITDLKKEINKVTIDMDAEVPLFLSKDGETITKITDFYQEDLNDFLDVSIEVLNNPNLSNVNAIIKVEFEFLRGCSEFESYYYIQSKDGLYIELPILDYAQCEYPTSKIAYVFPTQKFGVENTILKTRSFLNEDASTESIDQLKQIVWEERDQIEYTFNYEN